MIEARSLMAWLAEQWPLPLPFEDIGRPEAVPEQPTRLQVLAALLGMDAGGYGIIAGGRGRYGRIGLEQGEAYALWHLKSFIDGWMTATGAAEELAFKEALRAERARVEALNAQQEARV